MEQSFKIVPMPKDKFCWFREAGFKPRQKVEVIARYDGRQVRVRNPETGYYYLADILRDLGQIY